MDKVELPADLILGDRHLGPRARSSEPSNQGFVGSVFGTGYEKPGNVAGVVIIVAFLAIAAALVWLPDTGSISKKDIVNALLLIIMLALGYLFGRGSVKNAD